jgi:hypothetical protein
MRQTSLQAYNQIKANGLLSELRFMVYDCIYHSGPITQGECVDILMRDIERGNNSGTFGSRFAELKNLGVIVETGKRPCKITGRTCLEWDVTDKLPVKFERITKDQMIKALKEEIASLRERLNKIQAFHPGQLNLL